MATSQSKPKTKQQANDDSDDSDDDEEDDSDMTPQQKREQAFREMIAKKRGK